MESGKLIRQLGFWDSVAINIGIVIGVGIFRVPADVAQYLDHSSLILIAWVLGGVISLLGVLCFAELSSCYPETGGTYVYLREAYGKLTGFLFGWMEISVLRAGSLAGVAYIFAAHFRNFLDLGSEAERAIAILAILFFTVLNIVGLRYGTGVQNVLSSLKVILLALMCGLILTAGQKELSAPLPVSAPHESPWLGLAPALIPILWTYGGWNESTFMSGEFKDTHRALPRSLIASILIITILYVLMNMAYLKFMSPAEMVHRESIVADIFKEIFGRTGHLIISFAVVISAGGAINSMILTGARIPFAVAQDSKKLAWIGTVHKRFHTPARSYVINGIWASLLVLWGNFGELLFFTGFAKWFFFILTGWSVFILRRRSRNPEAFSMVGYPAVPALFTIVSMILFVTTIYHAPGASLLGFFILITGIPIYYVLRERGSKITD